MTLRRFFIWQKFKPRECGFTLLEVLIAIVVLSVGLLGLAALQMGSLRSTHYSYEVAVANLVAKDAKERLWGSLLNLSGKDYVTCPTDLSSENEGEEEVLDNRLSTVEVDVRKEWEGKLPNIYVQIDEAAEVCGYEIYVWWLNDRFGELDEPEGHNVQSGGKYSVLSYYLKLPGYKFEVE